MIWVQPAPWSPEVESSRTHFEVLGLEASSPRKLPCPRLEDSTIFEPLKFCWKAPETLQKICKDVFLVSSSRDHLKKIFEDLFRLKKFFKDLFFFFGEHLRLCPSSLASRGSRRVARNPQWGRCFGGLGAEPPAAGGQWAILIL